MINNYIEPINLPKISGDFVALNQHFGIIEDALRRGIQDRHYFEEMACCSAGLQGLTLTLKKAARLASQHAAARGKTCPTGIGDCAAEAERLAAIAERLNLSASRDLDAWAALHAAVWQDLNLEWKAAARIFEETV